VSPLVGAFRLGGLAYRLELFISIKNRMLGPAIFRPRGWDGHISDSVGQLIGHSDVVFKHRWVEAFSRLQLIPASLSCCPRQNGCGLVIGSSPSCHSRAGSSVRICPREIRIDGRRGGRVALLRELVYTHLPPPSGGK
jgi:hypothetical protein